MYNINLGGRPAKKYNNSTKMQIFSRIKKKMNKTRKIKMANELIIRKIQIIS